MATITFHILYLNMQPTVHPLAPPKQGVGSFIKRSTGATFRWTAGVHLVTVEKNATPLKYLCIAHTKSRKDQQANVGSVKERPRVGGQFANKNEKRK